MYEFCNDFVIATRETGMQLPSFMSSVNPVWDEEIQRCNFIETEIEISCVVFVCSVAQ